jgi:ferredoxin
MNGQPPPDIQGYDLFGLGTPVYYYRPPFNVTEYMNNLPGLNGLPFFVFMMHGMYRFDAGNMVRRALTRKGAKEVGYFHALGPDLFVGYLKEGYLFSPGHPSGDELARAEAFGRDVAAHVAGKQYVRPEDEQPPSIVYRLERFLTGRWFASNIYSRLFRVKRGKCTACGLCMELCPAGNVVEGKNRRPVWGRNCLLCLTCELKCPEAAVTSPASWRLFRPFMIYNTRMGSHDRSIEYVRTDPKAWQQVADGN